MKHIKIEVKNIKGWGKALKIVEQTHREFSFGNASYRFEYDGFKLKSITYPKASENTLYLLGTDKSKDNSLLTDFSDEWLEKVRKTVRAYNRYFSDGNDEDDTEVIE